MDEKSHPHLYRGETVLLTSKHSKEAVIAPVFRDRLAMTVTSATEIDTDQLGTFTGEIPRRGTMLETAIAKARLGMAARGIPLGLASEGSYGPDPRFPFVSAATEVMVLVDDARGIVIAEHLISSDTNFASRLVSPEEDLAPFLAMVRFPGHALIVRPETGAGSIYKAIQTDVALTDAIRVCAAQSETGKALITTDMRAHLNPTRMRVIGELTERLVSRIAARCPACASPGFGRSDVERGLVCEVCEQPTEMVKAEIFTCVRCDYREARPRRDGKLFAREGECAYCNP